jgi:NAD(P)-dependent dehydrogenase (short-subunit alcohol dehydrogenase family)
MRLAEKIIVITGAALGLGRAVATRFAREGATVVAVDIRESEGLALTELLVKHGRKSIFVHADVSDELAVKNVFELTVARFGRVDVLYNNAGVLPYDRDAAAHELALEAWDYVMNVNLRGAFLCAKYALPSMIERGRGSIIYVSSRTGLFGCAPKLTAYSASKAGIIGLTRVMAASYASRQIRVNSIIPGTMDTPMNGDVLANEQMREDYRKAVPLGRLGVPEDIEGLAVFLASDESSFCTGGLYTCDGGLTAV